MDRAIKAGHQGLGALPGYQQIMGQGDWGHIAGQAAQGINYLTTTGTSPANYTQASTLGLTKKQP